MGLCAGAGPYPFLLPTGLLPCSSRALTVYGAARTGSPLFILHFSPWLGDFFFEGDKVLLRGGIVAFAHPSSLSLLGRGGALDDARPFDY